MWLGRLRIDCVCLIGPFSCFGSELSLENEVDALGRSSSCPVLLPLRCVAGRLPAAFTLGPSSYRGAVDCETCDTTAGRRAFSMMGDTVRWVDEALDPTDEAASREVASDSREAVDDCELGLRDNTGRRLEADEPATNLRGVDCFFFAGEAIAFRVSWFAAAALPVCRGCSPIPSSSSPSPSPSSSDA
jgi:hypothetical protein